MKIDVVVTRHPGLVEYLVEEGIVTKDVEVLSHASPAEVTGRHVLGVLPHSLSCLTASFTEVPLRLTSELRGVELTAKIVRSIASPPVTYKIEQLFGERTHRKWEHKRPVPAAAGRWTQCF